MRHPPKYETLRTGLRDYQSRPALEMISLAEALIAQRLIPAKSD